MKRKTPHQLRVEQTLAELKQGPVLVVKPGEGINRTRDGVMGLRELGYTIEVKLNYRGSPEYHLIGEP